MSVTLFIAVVKFSLSLKDSPQQQAFLFVNIICYSYHRQEFADEFLHCCWFYLHYGLSQSDKKAKDAIQMIEYIE